jgi:hypothetical protein
MAVIVAAIGQLQEIEVGTLAHIAGLQLLW